MLLSFRALGLSLTENEPSLRERLEHPKILFKVWMPRCRSMRKEEKVSNHGLHLLKVVKT